MQLTITTDYAIRVLLSLKETGKLKRAIDISDEMEIPFSYLNKILRKLRESGIIGSVVGINGGHFLRKSLDDIRLLDVVKCIEPTIKINRCLEEDGFCNRNASPVCVVRKYWERMQEDYERVWLSVSLGDIIRQDAIGSETS